jgi:hypothetical protein
MTRDTTCQTLHKRVDPFKVNPNPQISYRVRVKLSGRIKIASPNSSDVDGVVYSTCNDVTKRVQFNSIDLSNHVLVVGNTFHDAVEFRKVMRQYNILRGKDLVVKRNVCDCIQRHKKQVWTSNIRC